MNTGSALMEWFSRLSQRRKVDFLRDLLAKFDDLDPKAKARMEMWTKGKTTRLKTDLATQDDLILRGVPIHLSVEDGDRALWRSLQTRVQSGKLDFVDGLTFVRRDPTSLVGDQTPNWTASMGIGTLSIQEYRGELLIRASKRRALLLPQGMQPGSSMPAEPPENEGFSILLLGGLLVISASFSRLLPREIRAARSSPVRVGIAKFSDGVMVLGMNVKGLTNGWADLPFALAIEKPENRHIIPAEMTGERDFLLVLTDHTTQKIAVMRLLRLSAQWSAEFDRILEAQQDSLGTYDREACLRDIKASHERWPTPNHVAKDFVAAELAQTTPIAEFGRTGHRS